jgi:hypothetical protein
MKYARYPLFVLALCIGLWFLPSGATGAANAVTWGEVQAGTYDSPSIYTLNWSGNVLDKGGYSLEQRKLTSSAAEADFVIDGKGSIGAASIAVLEGEELGAPSAPAGKAFSNTQKLVSGGIYWIERSDGSYAKLRVDRYNADRGGAITKVFFSYVLEQKKEDIAQPAPVPEPARPLPQPEPSPTSPVTDGRDYAGLQNPGSDAARTEYSYQVEEGPVTVPWKAVTSGSRYDVYRSDNGGAYVKMNDFSLEKPEYTDHYAFAEHTYVYRLASHGPNGKLTYSAPIKVTVTKKSMEKPKQVIELKLDSLSAKVNGKEHTLDAAPTLINGRTMVPLRFIGEALGAKVEWNGEDKSISMRFGDQTVGLKIDQSEATLNGQKVMMDVPAMIIGETTMVPVRFVSESLKQEVRFDNDTRSIIIAGGAGKNEPEKEEPLPQDPPKVDPPKENTPPETTPPAVPEQPDPYFLGTWELWVPGVPSDTPGGGGQYTTGKQGGILVIKADNTWQYTLGTKQYNGKWSQVKNSNEILLSNFQYGSDWQGRLKNGVFQIYTFGMYFVAAPK